MNVGAQTSLGATEMAVLFVGGLIRPGENANSGRVVTCLYSDNSGGPVGDGAAFQPLCN